MTKADKYLKDGVDVDDFIGEFNDFCAMQTSNQASSVRLAQFLSRKVKPTLTEDEKVILRNVKVQKTYDKYITIKREDEGTLIIIGECGAFGNLSMYAHLFQFIQPRRRI